MPKNSIRDYSATASSNTDIQSVDIDENCAASGINNAIREVMADLKDVSTGAVALESPQADSLTVTGDLTVDTNTLYVDAANNRVGVGTVSPSQEMHLYAGSGATDLLIEQGSTGNAYLHTKNSNREYAVGTGGDALRFIDLTADAERMRIDSGGSVGIGTSSPDQTLHVHKGSAGSVSSASSAVITVENNADAYIQFLTPNTNQQQIRFGDPQDNGIGILSYSHSDNSMRFATAGPEKMRIDSGGNLTFSQEASGSPYPEQKIKWSNDSTTANGFYVSQDTSRNGRVWHEQGLDLLFGTANTERMRIDSSGHIQVGQTSTINPGQGNNTFGSALQNSGRLFLSADGTYSLGLNRSDSGELTNFSRAGSFKGSITINASSVSYNTTSDHRLKQNVVDMTGAIDRVKTLAPKRFDFISDAGNTVDGFLAHEAQAVVPEAVTGTHNEVDDDGNPKYQQIDQAKLIPLLVGALQESITKIETLETEMTALKARVTALEA